MVIPLRGVHPALRGARARLDARRADPRRFAERGAAGPGRAARLARPVGDGLGHAACGHEPHHAEHRQRAVALARAARALPGELHPRVRPSALVLAPAVRRPHGALRPGDGLPRAFARPRARRPGLSRRAVRRLHVLPRRARAREARPCAPDPLLPDDFARRRARRGAGRDRRAPHAARVLRAGHRPGAARDAFPVAAARPDAMGRR
jgi:hypothetical protein